MDDGESGEHNVLKDQNLDYSFQSNIVKVEYDVTWKDVWYQIVASNLGYLTTVHAGINLTFSNLLLKEFDKEITSWFASIIGFSTPIGSCLSGPLMDKLGRKRANLVAVFPCILSWILIYRVGSDDVFLLYSARFLAGIAGGLVSSNMVYVSEISHKKYRPIFLSLLGFYFSFGILLMTILQAFLTWRQTALFNFVFFIAVFMLVAIFTPESPVWLASFRTDWIGAKRALRSLIANDQVFESEWIHLQESIRIKEGATATKKLKLSSPIVYKPLIILLVLLMLQQLSCIYLVIMYALKIFPLMSSHVSQLVIDEAFIVFGILRFISSIVGSIMSSKLERRTLMMSSSGGMMVTSFIIAIAVAVRGSGIHSSTSMDQFCEWTSLTLFLLFIFFGTYGVMVIPWTLIVELFPTKIRSIGSTSLISYGYLTLFFLAKIFPFVVDSFNTCLVFVFISSISALFGLFVYFCVPETFGKSFDDIQRYFSSHSWSLYK